MTKPTQKASRRRKKQKMRVNRSVVKMLIVMSESGEDPKNFVDDFLTSGRTGRRNALPDIMGENSLTTTADVTDKFTQLTTTDSPQPGPSGEPNQSSGENIKEDENKGPSFSHSTKHFDKIVQIFIALLILLTMIPENFLNVIHLRNKMVRNNSVHFKFNDKEKIQTILKPVLIIAQFIGVLPLHGIYSYRSQVRFVTKSFKTFFSLLLIFLSGFVTILTSIRLIGEPVISYRILGDIIFYGSSTLSMILCFRLAIIWKKLMYEWSKVDNFMVNLKPTNAQKKIYILVIVFIPMAICEHLFANQETYFNYGQCGRSSAHLFYINAFKQVFTHTEYQLWKGIFLSGLNLLITLAWNFTDLFLMSISIAISSKFQQLNEELKSVENKDKSVKYWKKIREAYNRMTILTKKMDETLSPTILVSFTNNLYFICLQLLNSLKPIESISKIAYFILSFTHLLFRTCGVCWTASNIYEHSKEPLSSLFSVSSNSYNIEVQRMIAQVNFDIIAITGFKFFTITRTLMLTVAGTIVTYEIVLVQFNALTHDGINTEKDVVCPPD